VERIGLKKVSDLTYNIVSIYFSNVNLGNAVCSDGSWLRTDNGGDLFISVILGQGESLNSVCFPDANTGYFVGSSGITDVIIRGRFLNIYPSPSGSDSNVETPVKDSLSIISLSGLEFPQQEITEPTTTINVSGLNSGIYFVRLMGERTVQVGKFIKQ